MEPPAKLPNDLDGDKRRHIIWDEVIGLDVSHPTEAAGCGRLSVPFDQTPVLITPYIAIRSASETPRPRSSLASSNGTSWVLLNHCIIP